MNFKACGLLMLCLLSAEYVAADCNDTESDWFIEWVGKSTKFRLSNDCEDRSLTVSMSSLTEFSASNDKKTNNKVTSFASSKDWLDGSTQEYQGSDVIYNKFQADDLKKGSASFVLETRFFLSSADIIDGDGNNVTVDQYSLKFDVGVTDWTYLDAANYLTLCIDLTSSSNSSDSEEAEEDEENESVTDDYQIDNVYTAECIGSSESETMNVTITSESSGNKLTLCYAFQACDGDISYDPTIIPLETESDEMDETDSTDPTDPTDPPSNNQQSAANSYSMNVMMFVCLLCVIMFA